MQSNSGGCGWTCIRCNVTPLALIRVDLSLIDHFLSAASQREPTNGRCCVGVPRSGPGPQPGPKPRPGSALFFLFLKPWRNIFQSLTKLVQQQLLNQKLYSMFGVGSFFLRCSGADKFVHLERFGQVFGPRDGPGPPETGWICRVKGNAEFAAKLRILKLRLGRFFKSKLCRCRWRRILKETAATQTATEWNAHTWSSLSLSLSHTHALSQSPFFVRLREKRNA